LRQPIAPRRLGCGSSFGVETIHLAQCHEALDREIDGRVDDENSRDGVALARPSFDKQRDVEHGDLVSRRQSRQSLCHQRADGRMHDGIQIQASVVVVKDDRGQRLAIEPAIRAENISAESFDHSGERLGSRFDNLAGELVGIHECGSTLHEQLADRRLARADPTGETDGDHSEEGRPDRDATPVIVAVSTLAASVTARPARPESARSPTYTTAVVHPESRSRKLLVGALELIALAALAYVPLLLTKGGMVAADTKQYLYLDPGRFMAQSISMWDSSVAAGGVTHEQIGYLLPMGPFYWLLAALRAPVWVAQRLWMGSLLFLAGAGVRYAVKTLGLTGAGPFVAGAVYLLSPYSMQYIERISAILMPWAGLGWMLGFTVLALRNPGWKYPALFAIVVALTGGINATSLIYAGLAPILWVLYALFATRDSAPGRIVAGTLKIGFLSLVVSLWWIVGLRIESKYGLDILRFTEQVPAIAGPAIASEVMRGLGYWFFYGSDRLGPWLSSNVEYTQRVSLLEISFAVPVLGFLGAIVTRWKPRGYFVFLALVGIVLSVGTHPFSDPSIVGGVLKAFMTKTTAGFALRSTDRATPLVVLALSALLGAGLSALATSLATWRPRIRFVAVVPAGLAVALAIVNAGPLMTGLAVDAHFERPEHIPSYFVAAAKYLDAQGNSTRVLIEPGDDFADYDWGTTVDQVWPGILTRPSIERWQQIDGSAPTADLLAAFDLTLQQGTYEPSTLAPIARLFSAGDVVLESDDQYWHYNTPPPKETWALFNPPPAGVLAPHAFGKPVPNEAPAAYAMLDEQALATPTDAPWPPPLAVFPVTDARPIYRAEPASTPLVLDGSGAGIVDAAGAGLLADNPTIFYAGTLDGHPALLADAVPPGADLVLTDTNRKELRAWASVRDNIGETLPATPGPQTPDPTQQPLQVFANASNSTETIATYSDAHYVSASSYGNPVALTPEDRPYMAFDGNPSTAWTTSAFSAADGQWLQVALDQPATTNYLDLVQPYLAQPNRWITKVTLTFDGSHKLNFSLGAASRRASGQIVRFPTRSFTTLRVTIDATTGSNNPAKLGGASGVGFAEVGIPGVNIFETMQLPSDLLSSLGSSSLSHRLTIVLTRDRVAPYPPRTDPELFMSRSFSLPTARTFAIGGTARISALIPDNEIDDILGGPNVFGGAVLGSNERLPGDLNARAVFAFDNNPATFWGPGFDAQAQVGAWMQANLTHPVTFDHLNLQVLADGAHSVPTELRITTNQGGNVLLHLPAVRDVNKPGAVATIPISFKPVTGSVLRFTVEAVRQRTTINWYSAQPIVLPFAIASIGVPGLHFTPENPAAQIPAVCRDDLMTVDGTPVWLKVTGTVGTAEASGGLQITGCGPDAHGIKLGPGAHHVVTKWGKLTGLNIDQLVLDSAPGGAAEPMLADGDPRPVPGTLAGGGSPALAAPSVHVLSQSATTAQVKVSRATGPFWLVLGESIDAGWNARIAGGTSLGTSTLIDGYANGWYVPHGGSFVVDLVWTPQHDVDIALAVSAGAIFICLVLGFVPLRRLRRSRRDGTKGGRSKGAHGKGARDPPDETSAGAHGRDPPQVAAHAASAGAAEPVAPDGPFSGGWPATLSKPWLAAGRPAGVVACILAAVVAGGLSALVLPHPWGAGIGIAVAVGTFACARLGGLRLALTITAVGGACAAGAITITGQMTHHYVPGDSWPGNFPAANIVAFVAFLALMGDATVELVRGRAAVRFALRADAAPDTEASDDAIGDEEAGDEEVGDEEAPAPAADGAPEAPGGRETAAEAQVSDRSPGPPDT
jgi:arabinofuranan 3-O-arabinosyltransferase